MALGKELALIVLAVEALVLMIGAGVLFWLAIRGVRRIHELILRGLRFCDQTMASVEGFVARSARNPLAAIIPLAGIIARVANLGRGIARKQGAVRRRPWVGR